LVETLSFTTATRGLVTGRILDEKGNPVKDARIVFDTGEEAVTKSDGSFSLEVTAGNRSAVIYDRNGNVIGTFDLFVIAGEESDIGEQEVSLKAEGKSFPWWIVAILVLALLLIVGILAVLLVLKGSSEEEFEDEEWEDDEEEWFIEEE